MALQVVTDLFREVRRLSVAGIKLSKNDFRLRNNLGEIAKIKDSSPVMQRLYSGGMKVLESRDDEIVDNFFELSNLVVAVMVTQADTQKAGELTRIPNISMGSPAEISFTKLYPVMEALTSAGAGRTKVIAEYFESGLPVDIRLIDLLLNALQGYAEIAECAKELLKKTNSNILPIIQNSFEIKGNRGDGRRLELIYHFTQNKNKELYVEALTGGSREVMASAIKILLCFKDGEKIIKDYAKQQDKVSKESINNLMDFYKKERAENQGQNVLTNLLSRMKLIK